MAIPENPITRKETFLAKAAGQDVPLPEGTLTREEAYLRAIAENGGGGGSTTAESVSYDNTDSGLTATNVQDAIDELASGNEEIVYVDKTGDKTVGEMLDALYPLIDFSKLTPNSKLVFKNTSGTFKTFSFENSSTVTYGGYVYYFSMSQGVGSINKTYCATIRENKENFHSIYTETGIQENGNAFFDDDTNDSFTWARAYILY